MTIDQGQTTAPNDSATHLRTMTVLPQMFRRRGRGTDGAIEVEAYDAVETYEAPDAAEEAEGMDAVEVSHPAELVESDDRDVREFLPVQRTPGSGPFGPTESWDVTHRAEFIEQMECRLAAGERLALVSFGLDRFQKINDSAGLEAGDVALRNAHRVLRWMLGPSNVAYFGSDCFAALLSHDETTGGLVQAALDRLARTDLSDELTGIFATASAGMVVVEGSGTAIDDVLYTAEYALRAAKDLGGNRMVVERPSAASVAFTESA